MGEKYGLARNIAQEVDTIKTGLHAEVTQRSNLEYSGGGCALNTVRVFQWLSPTPNSAVFLGGLGKDDSGAVLESLVNSDAVLTAFAKVIYVEGYFLSHSPEAAMELARFAQKHRITFVFNLCGEYVCEDITYVENVLAILTFIDILFGNLSEFEVFIDTIEAKLETSSSVIRNLRALNGLWQQIWGRPTSFQRKICGRRQLYRGFHLCLVTRRLSALMHRVCDLDGSEDDPASRGDPAQDQTRTSDASNGKKGNEEERFLQPGLEPRDRPCCPHRAGQDPLLGCAPALAFQRLVTIPPFLANS